MTDEEYFEEMLRKHAQRPSQSQPKPQFQPQPQAQPKPQPRFRKPSAIVSQDRLRTQRSSVERYSAYILLLVSGVGTIAALHGSWIAMVHHLIPAAVIGGILIQAVLTFLEWYYYDHPYVAWGARVIDTYCTALGFGPLFLAWLVTQLAARSVPGAVAIGMLSLPVQLVAAWVIIGIVSLGIAWFPETRLVD
jgi:hypothetical protein